MNIVVVIIGAIVLPIAIFVVYRYLKVQRQNKKLNEKRFERVRPLYEKFESGSQVTADEVLPYASNILTRQLTYQILDKHNQLNLFPPDYLNIVKAAETNLANWLEFPTELDACPDQIEHIKRVTIDFDGQNNFVHYEVFKYRMNEPHWAAKSGWMLGVVGPYFDDSKPYDNAPSTFSRLSSNVTAEEEAKWVHEKISLRRPR